MQLNDYVEVELTSSTQRYWARLCANNGRDHTSNLQSDGTWRFLLWELMYFFGPIVSQGTPPPFVGGEVTPVSPTSGPDVIKRQPFWQFKCERCTSEVGAEMVDVRFIGADMGGNPDDYFVECPVCGYFNPLPPEHHNLRVTLVAQRWGPT